MGWPASPDASLPPPQHTPRQVWESAGRAAPQKGPPPRRGGSSCRAHAKRCDPGAPGAGADPTANFRSGRRRGHALSSRGSRHHLPTVPSRAALTASSQGASAGEGSGHAPTQVLSLAGPGRRLPERAGPSPREAQPPAPPSPRGRGPQPHRPAAGRRSCPHRADPRGSRGAGRGVSVPARGAPRPPIQGGGAIRSLISALPLPGLGRTWESRGSGKESGLHRLPLEGGRGGATLPYSSC